MINATDLVCGERFFMRKKAVTTTAITIGSFWIIKFFVALLTLGVMGIMISFPTIAFWELFFEMFSAEGTPFANFFISALNDGGGMDVKELAVNYLRIGILEMPIVGIIAYITVE